MQAIRSKKVIIKLGEKEIVLNDVTIQIHSRQGVKDELLLQGQIDPVVSKEWTFEPIVTDGVAS